MSQFLRDTTFKNLSLSEEGLREINTDLVRIREEVNQSSTGIKALKIIYVIRFDQKGFMLYDFNEFLVHFQSAKSVERMVLQLVSDEHIQSNKTKGKCIDIHFDATNFNNCFVIVQDDNHSWVDSMLPRMVELIKKFSNKNYLFRNWGITFLVQILGVFLGILFSLWLAVHFSKNLRISNPFGFTFLIAFVLFSNVWTYLYPLCLKAIDYFWPNIAFKERGFFYKICRGLFLTGFTGLFFAMFGWLGHKVLNFIASIFIK